MRVFKCYGEDLILKEMRKSFDFFRKEVNLDEKSQGYGLVRDKTLLSNEVASIASVGYGLAALIIGVERKWISFDKAYDRVNQTLDTFLNQVEGKNRVLLSFCEY